MQDEVNEKTIALYIKTGKLTARTAAEQPQEPHPVIPIVLTAGKPAEKLKEITDRLEQGITELFDSERYKDIDSTNTMLVCRRKGGQNVTDRQDYRFILQIEPGRYASRGKREHTEPKTDFTKVC